MEGPAFLNYIWNMQPRGIFYLVQRVGDSWVEHEVDFTQSINVDFKMPKDGDLYFCPNAFEAGGRKKSLCLPGRLMYQDLDESDPRELALHPELWWETSPGRYQAVWVLDREIEPEELQQLNRALNRASHADPGTWNLTRLLRVPGSWNAKRGCRVSRAYESVVAAA